MSLNIALVGAGGKMGCRLTDNLKNSQYTMRYIEVSDAGIDRLAQRGIKVSSGGGFDPGSRYCDPGCTGHSHR